MTDVRGSDSADPGRSGTERPSAVPPLESFYGPLDTAHDGVLITDPDGAVSYLNRALEEQTGLDPNEVVGRAVAELLGRDGEALDPATGLARDTLLAQRAHPLLALARRKDRAVAVGRLTMELGGSPSDPAEREVPDGILRAVAERLIGSLRDSDLVGRLDDGSFVLVLQEVEPDESLGRAAGRIVAKASEPVDVDGTQVGLTGRLGIALFPRDASGWRELLDRAGGALERAHAAGADFMFHEETFTARTRDRLKLEADFAAADDASALLLHYQPVVATEGGHVVGAEALTRGRVMGIEALARWPHTGRGLVPPAEFIPIAEATGRILSLDRWAIATALRQGSAWWERGWDGWVSVNLSVRSLRDPDIVGFVRDLLKARGLAGDRLMLEVTESAAMRDPKETIAILHALKQLGVRIAIDDFGTGHSSLGYLKRLPVDIIKLDRSFIQDLGSEERDRWLVESIVTLAHRMGAQIVAEGVEQPDELEWLRAAGCDLVQGFLTGRPAPAEALDPGRS